MSVPSLRHSATSMYTINRNRASAASRIPGAYSGSSSSSSSKATSSSAAVKLESTSYSQSTREASSASGRTSTETYSSGFGGLSGDLPGSPAKVTASRQSDKEVKSGCRSRLWDRKSKLSSSAVTSTSTSSSIGSDSVGKRKADYPPSRAATASASAVSSSHGMMHSMGPVGRCVDRYEILDTLGEGYSGKVKRGRDIHTHDIVALKVIFMHPNDPVGNKKFERLQAEVDAMKRCGGHPHIVKLYNPLLNEEYPKRDRSIQPAHILVLELCEKGELFELLYRGGPVPPNVSQEYFRQLMSGISYCHSQHVSHRDLKPENLLLDSNFTLKIADFGFAATERSSMGCQSIVGSKTYMAPEVLNVKVREYNGYLADVWSAGVILFTMLAGHPPMEKADQTDWWFRALRLGRLDLFWQSHKRTLPDTFSKDAEDLISSMLTVTPGERITVAEIMQHPYLMPVFRRGFAFRHAVDPLPELRAEMQHRYQLAMASKRLCTLTSSSRGTADSAWTSNSGSPSRGSGGGGTGGGGGGARGRHHHSPFEQSVYRSVGRSGEDVEDVEPPIMGLEEASRVTGGFMANGQPSNVVKALHRILHEMGAQIDGVQRDGPRTFRTSFKVVAMIPAGPDSGGGDVRIVATVFRLHEEGLSEEIPDLVVILRRKGGDYYRYLKVEDSLISKMTTSEWRESAHGPVSMSPTP